MQCLKIPYDICVLVLEKRKTDFRTYHTHTNELERTICLYVYF